MISGYMENDDINVATFSFEAMQIHAGGSWNVLISGFCKASFSHLVTLFILFQTFNQHPVVGSIL